MGQAKRKKSAMINGKFWTYETADDYPVENLSLDEALNFLGYYTHEQAKKAMPNMTPWDISKMKVNDRIYQSVKKYCLKTGLLWNVKSGESIMYSHRTLNQIAYWQKKHLSTKKRRFNHAWIN